MSFQKAKEHLQKYGLANNIVEFSTSSATVKEAAKALHCKEEEIAKTMSFFVEDKAILIVTAGDQKIENAKFKAFFKNKGKMIPSLMVEDAIGHSVGGVCPFGILEKVTVYLDISLKRFDIVYPACGSDHSAVKLTIEQLEKASNFKQWIDVCKKIEKD